MNIEEVLRQFGYAIRPMSEAPRDGRNILGISERRGLVICFWEVDPSKLAGATWSEEKDAERGYIDRYFAGWLDSHSFERLQRAALVRLLGAYLEDTRAKSNRPCVAFVEFPRAQVETAGWERVAWIGESAYARKLHPTRKLTFMIITAFI